MPRHLGRRFKAASRWRILADGKLLATATDDWQIKLWNVTDGHHHLATLVGHTDPITSLAFSPDNRTLASGSLDGTIRLWHCQTGQYLLSLEGHQGQIQALAFSPDGEILASGAQLGENRSEIYLWHAPANKR